MVEFTLLERLGLIFNLIFSSPLFLILLFGIAIMLIDSFIISKKSKKVKVAYTIISVISIIILLQNYYDSVLSVLDTIGKNIVAIIYFPSVLEYIITILISLIILFISIFSKKINSILRKVNIIVFSINMLFFFLILDEISKNEIDLTNKLSVYNNQNLMALFETALIIFAIWMIGLILYKIIYKLTHKNEVKIDNNFYEEPELPKTLEELRKEELIPPPQIEYVLVEKKNDNDMFTLDEYRALKKVLESIRDQK